MVICIDKPLTWTSADVVRKIKFRLQRCWQEKKVKVGHAGTLDPLATGLLLVCVGPATKQSEFYQSQPKEYIARIQLGATNIFLRSGKRDRRAVSLGTYNRGHA